MTPRRHHAQYPPIYLFTVPSLPVPRVRRTLPFASFHRLLSPEISASHFYRYPAAPHFHPFHASSYPGLELAGAATPAIHDCDTVPLTNRVILDLRAITQHRTLCTSLG